MTHRKNVKSTLSIRSFMPAEVKEVMKHMNKYTWESTEVEKEGIERGQQQWNETQIQIATALQASWTGALARATYAKRSRRRLNAFRAQAQ
jgi:hypothetical protein